MPKQSAGLLLYRIKKGFLEVFLVHPGGTFWKNKDLGAWSIPKGEFSGEPPLEAKRELKEETGFSVRGPFIELTPIKQKGGKWVYAWAVEADVDSDKIISNTLTLTFASGSSREFSGSRSGELVFRRRSEREDPRIAGKTDNSARRKARSVSHAM